MGSEGWKVGCELREDGVISEMGIVKDEKRVGRMRGGV